MLFFTNSGNIMSSQNFYHRELWHHSSSILLR